MQPLRAGQLARRDRLAHESATNATTLLLRSDRGIEQESMSASVSDHIDKADKSVVLTSGYPTQRMVLEAVTPGLND
ncbi:hypothetical protein AX769_17175 [Frondihabitans sp. PAMC 28766]|nr:hypothetical protein AX769_17175 [Frondihabitans sp. PAMC 28766]